ncbi:MAG: ABC transporter permease [Trueperaceae bacterium]
MIRYLLRRLAFLGLTVILVSMLVFAVTQLLPGDPARILLGREAGAAALAEVRRDLGLDQPVPVQYGRWAFAFASGDWGTSYASGQAIRPLVTQRMRASMRLAGLTLLIAVPLALLLGVVAALYVDRWPDTLVSVSALAVVGLPEFVTGLVLIQIFSFQLGWLPANASVAPDATFLQTLPQLILPAVTATLVMLAYVARLTRASVVEEMRRPYVRTARLKGIRPGALLRRHVLRNALLPAITVIAISFGWLISGLIVVENVFNYPGLGRLLTFAIDRRDLPMLQAITLVAVLAFALANLLADLAYAWLDPRIRLA